MALWPKSRKARRRLTLVLAAAPVLAMSVGLAVYALGDAVMFFYTPSQLTTEAKAPGRPLKLGGLVETGSVVRSGDGVVRFVVTDGTAKTQIAYRGDLPDLFREGQGIVAEGSFDGAGVLQASQVLAKHDETYMPREVADAMREQGTWRGGPPS